MIKVSDSVKKAESDALKALFTKHYSGSQAQFAREFGLGTTGMVWQYLAGRRPLNLEAALKFAAALRVPLSAFSKRLSAQAAKAQTLILGGTAENRTISPSLVSVQEPTATWPLPGWPFPSLDQRRFDRLPAEEREVIEALVLKRVTDVEARLGMQRELGA